MTGCVSNQGCNKQRERDVYRAKRAAEDLSQLFRSKLDVSIDPLAFRLFLQIHFHRVSSLAHTIHDNEE